MRRAIQVSFAVFVASACSSTPSPAASSTTSTSPTTGAKTSTTSAAGATTSATGSTGSTAGTGGQLGASTVRIACGQTAPVTDSTGKIWSADVDFSGGVTAVNQGQPVHGTPDAALYDGQRYGGAAAGGVAAFSYAIPVGAGAYTVTLKFTENSATVAGERVFDVTINGLPVLTNFDIFAAAGGQWIAVDRAFPVALPSAGTIDIQFEPGASDAPKVDAISVLPANGGTTTTTTTMTGGSSAGAATSSGGAGASSSAATSGNGSATGGSTSGLTGSGTGTGGSATGGGGQPICYGQVPGGSPTDLCNFGNPQTQAQRTADFIDTIGANTHISTLVANYTDPATDLADLQYLGIVHARDYYNSAEASVYTTLGQAGIRFDFLMYGGGNYAPTDLQAEYQALEGLEAAAPGAVFAVEGANEVNNWPATYNGVTGLQGAIDLQQDIYSMAHADPGLPGITVYYFTGYDLGGNANGPDPSVTPGLADEDTAHPYPQGGMPPLEGVANTPSALNPNRTNALTNETSTADPAVYTESGYRLSDSGEPQSAIWDLELLLDDAQQGILRTYLYELEQEAPGAADADAMGLFDGANDDQPTPPATAIHDATTLLADTGANSTTFTPGMLEYSLSNLPPLGHAWLMQKSNGTFELALWTEVSSPSATSMTVSLGGTYGTVNVYDPIQSAAAIQTASNVSAITVSLGQDPLIVEVVP